MKRIALVSSLLATAAIGAQAQTFIDNARVRSVEPQYESVSVPREVCTQQVVNEVQRTGSGHNVAGAIVGGVLGGVLGRQVGGGTGRDVATVVGAVAGAAAGNHIGGQYGYDQVQEVQRPVTNCRTVHEVQNRINGYRVSYDYHGQMYTTVMPHDPGRHMQVRVSLDPVVR